jgi:hypothetical protein
LRRELLLKVNGSRGEDWQAMIQDREETSGWEPATTSLESLYIVINKMQL